MSSKRGVAAALLAVISLSAVPAQVTPPRYRLTVIQPLGGDLETQGAAINNRGEVAAAGAGPGSARVYSWKAGVTTRFDETAGRRPPVDINDDGWILSANSGLDFTLSKKGQSTTTVTDLPYSDYLVPTAINKAKTVVGNGQQYPYRFWAFMRKLCPALAYVPSAQTTPVATR